MACDLLADGYTLISGVLAANACKRLAGQLYADGAGTRELLSRPWCAELAADLRRHPALAPLIPASHVAVQCTGFDKSAGQNWLVPIHQDLSVPVTERVSDPALTGWSEKEGRLYVQPPRDVLEDLIAVRLHLDDCGPAEGPLRVVPGSHRQGRVGQAQMLDARDTQGEVTCLANRGDALLMRPLLLHASSKSTGERPRRVLHFVYGPRVLPLTLRWAQAI
ncbi:phytanoyl-CoA dioxygenase family protein [Ralstonia sp. UBA689]|uniref:phytanoyl-CoA dioxygenase family protein n=1 Tax=Ralstonia sp. UBA689 TaxID=1947373 RepID=UPI0025D1800F|nr:phytanoyl-CoA dioxygenase family protein [Ralstonia sp. UBA689]